MKKHILALLICVGGVCAVASAQETDNSDLWKGNNKELQLGYVTGSFDLGADGGKLAGVGARLSKVFVTSICTVALLGACLSSDCTLAQT